MSLAPWKSPWQGVTNTPSRSQSDLTSPASLARAWLSPCSASPTQLCGPTNLMSRAGRCCAHTGSRGMGDAQMMIFNDATTMYRHSLPSPDIYIATPPCQPFSPAGNQQGTTDERGRLIYHPIQVVKTLTPPPKIVVIENVLALLQRHKLVYDKLVSELEETGSTMLNKGNPSSTRRRMESRMPGSGSSWWACTLPQPTGWWPGPRPRHYPSARHSPYSWVAMARQSRQSSTNKSSVHGGGWWPALAPQGRRIRSSTWGHRNASSPSTSTSARASLPVEP